MNDYNDRHCCYQNNNACNMNFNNEDDMIDESSPCSNLCTTQKNNCECGFDMDTESVFPDNPMFGQSYVPVQRMNKVFTPEVGLKMGTIFPELVSPYTPCQSIRTIEFLKNSNELGEGCNK